MKLAAALAVPLVALALVTSLEVVQTSSAVGDIRKQTELARSSIGPAGLITTIQNERTWALVEIMGIETMVQVQDEGYDQTRAATDQAIADFQDEITSRGGQVARVYGPALEGLGELQRIRADIDAFTAPRSLSNIDFDRAIFQRYTELVEPLFDATTRVSYDVNDAELREGTKMADAVARQIETISQVMILTLGNAMLSPGGVNEPQEISDISALLSDYQRQDQIMLSGTGVYDRIADELFPEQMSEDVNRTVDEAVATTRVVDAEGAIAAMNVERNEGYLGFQDAVHEAINSRADDLNQSAESRRLWLTLLAAVAFTAAVVLTWVVSRSITRPLRNLTVQATEMAEKRLPDAVLDILETPLGNDVQVPRIEPVTVTTRDEVSDVATALNTVQESALDLAVEQAVLRRNIADSFVNLGRRNQNLLGRQLDFITELESNETDPDTLASLFRLDHLATRMRRNAESLLVLAGIDPPRKWAAPVRLNDVIRAALGEVENYQRVSLRGVEPATVVGSVAADLAHLVAELVENALTFSPPDRAVDVMGGVRQDGGYSLAVVDSGFGMPPEDIDQANRRLAGSESFTVAPSKYLGHYVAGNLAARHGITIQLRESPGSGVTATVDLPPALITAEAARGAVVTDPRGTRAVATLPFSDGPASAAAQAGPSGQPAPQPGAPYAPNVTPAGPPSPFAPAAFAPPAPPGGNGGPPGNGGAPGNGGPAHAQPAAFAPDGGPSWAASPPGAGFGPGEPDPGPPTMPAPALEPPSRTASGLVKRNRRSQAEAQRPANVPTGELLSALQGHTGMLPQAEAPQPQARQPEFQQPQVQQPQEFQPQAFQPPPVQQPEFQQPQVQQPEFQQPQVGQPEVPQPEAAPADQTGTTPSGLVRRVKGAQMPVAQPLSLRRGDQAQAQPAAPGPAPAPPAPAPPPPNQGGPQPPGDDGAARDVYGFLSSFSSGVQRGLDESRGS